MRQQERGPAGRDREADGGFSWKAVGNGTQNTVNPLDTSGANEFGSCAVSTAAEDACSLNKVAGNDAEDPRVASGTQIIDELGPEHMRTGSLIVYTSADSVFQIAAHEDVVPVPELYRACERARRHPHSDQDLT